MARRLFVPNLSRRRFASFDPTKTQSAQSMGSRPRLKGRNPMIEAMDAIPKELKAHARKRAIETIKRVADRAMGGGMGMVLKNKAKGMKFELAKALTANGSVTKSSTYFGKVPKTAIISSNRYRVGTRKELYSYGLDIGDVAANYGIQKAYSVVNICLNTDLRYDQENIKDTTWYAWKAQVLEVKGTLMFNNNDIANGFLDIYECVARVNSSKTPVQAWIDGCADISSVYTPEDIGAVPYRVPGFNRLYKIIKRTRVPISPGCTHEHTFRYGSFRPYTNVDITLNDSVIKGQTFSFMFVISGTPVRTTDGVITTSTPIITMAGNAYRTTRVVDNSAPFYSEGSAYATITPTNLIIREHDGDVVTGTQGATLQK